MTRSRPTPCGFTLVEMAVVIVIIGLVAGGIIMGKELITQAEIRTVISEYDRYLKSMREFQDKYNAMPGDMSNAESMWGTDSGGCPNTTYTSALPVTTNTCNGDGDGLIGVCTEDFSVACSDMAEIWRAWQHLSNAGFVDGRYAGIGRNISGNLSGAAVGVNAPASKRTPAGWTWMHYSNPSDETWLAGGPYGHVLMFGDGWPKSNLFTTAPALPSKDAAEIDRKIDDSRPKTGKLRAWENAWGGTTCISADSKYDLCSGNACLCGLIFVTDF